MSRRLFITSFAAGFIAITAQSIIIRELVIAFLGNELVIGVTLGAWLLWTGIGSIALGRPSTLSSAANRLSGALIAMALLLPTSFLAVADIRSIAGLQAGEIPGPLTVIAACIGVLAPLCLLNGSLFPNLCWTASQSLNPREAIARIYVREAAGATVGGVIFSAALVRIAQPMYVLLMCALVLLAAARYSRQQPSRYVTVFFWLALLQLCVLLDPPWAWRPRPEQHVNTVYGRTAVVRRQETTSIFQNGILSATHPVAGTSEELSHLAMLQIERPRRVLLIGGLGGTAEDVLRYGGIHADIVELDPESVEFVRQHVPPSPLLAEALTNGRARLLFRDGRRHVTRHDGEPYDAIILDLPKPVTAQINRYYTVEFFRAAARILSDRGVLAFRVESAENIATPEVGDFVACLRRTLRAVFADVAVTPGTSNVFMAAKCSGLLTLDPEVLLRRLDERKVSTAIFTDTVAGDLEPFNVQILGDALDESRSSRVNTDLHPISYSHGLAVWAAKDRTPRSGPLDRLVNKPTAILLRFAALPPAARWGIGLAAAAACVVALFLVRPRRSVAVGLAVACGGFTEISIEIAVLLAFQAFYGYVYALLGLILASFMVGLCVGGWLASRIIARSARLFRALALTQAALALYPLVLIASIGCARTSGGADWAVAAVFMILTFTAGLVGGLQFPLAAAVATGGSGNVVARLSALDLCGAALGAFSVSAFLIPTVGLETLAVFLAGLGAVALAGFGAARPRKSGATLS